MTVIGMAQALKDVVQESVLSYVPPRKYVIYVLCSLNTPFR
jgi:hypothetical protein